MPTAIVLFLLGLYALYLVIRLAVTHGMRDALLKDAITRAELTLADRPE